MTIEWGLPDISSKPADNCLYSRLIAKPDRAGIHIPVRRMNQDFLPWNKGLLLFFAGQHVRH